MSSVASWKTPASPKPGAGQIYRSLTANPELEKRTMSVAEKLKAEGRMEGISQGRVEGRAEGLWIGKIQTLEEFLEQQMTPRETLEAMTLAELEARHQDLHHQYELRFKRR
jgi:predicted transposase YdaD